MIIGMHARLCGTSTVIEKNRERGERRETQETPILK